MGSSLDFASAHLALISLLRFCALIMLLCRWHLTLISLLGFCALIMLPWAFSPNFAFEILALSLFAKIWVHCLTDGVPKIQARSLTNDFSRFRLVVLLAIFQGFRLMDLLAIFWDLVSWPYWRFFENSDLWSYWQFFEIQAHGLLVISGLSAFLLRLKFICKIRITIFTAYIYAMRIFIAN